MRATMLNKIGAPLNWMDLADRQPGPNQIRVSASACGVCRTDLHVVDRDLPLWEERSIFRFANLMRQDGIDVLRLAPRVGIVTSVTEYPLRQANEALADLWAGRSEGAAVLVP
jgi:D-arabinose 1-dehydrogenase-like Zn-dependent alcohol dehydrogenase